MVAAQSVRDRESLHRARIVPADPRISGKPQVALRILGHSIDLVVWETVVGGKPYEAPSVVLGYPSRLLVFHHIQHIPMCKPDVALRAAVDRPNYVRSQAVFGAEHLN